MSGKEICSLCDRPHVKSELISNKPNCQHVACRSCLFGYISGMRQLGMLSLGCWHGSCQQPLAGHTLAMK